MGQSGALQDRLAGKGSGVTPAADLERAVALAREAGFEPATVLKLASQGGWSFVLSFHIQDRWQIRRNLHGLGPGVEGPFVVRLPPWTLGIGKGTVRLEGPGLSLEAMDHPAIGEPELALTARREALEAAAAVLEKAQGAAEALEVWLPPAEVAAALREALRLQVEEGRRRGRLGQFPVVWRWFRFRGDFLLSVDPD